MTSNGDSQLIRQLVDQALDACRIPRATYRLQVSPSFGFRQAAAVVPYLEQLGVSDCYVSPILKARPGSTHGYDICDPTQLNPELGTEAEFIAFATALKKRGMGLIIDVVPNHMGIGHPANLWWMDVLENGPASAHAGVFDIEWQPVTPELAGKVLLAVLEDQYGRELERGKFRLTVEGGTLWLRYDSQVFPVAPKSYIPLLSAGLTELTDTLPSDHPDLAEYQSIITALEYLPARAESDLERIAERQREKEVIKRRLANLLVSSREAAAAFDGALTLFNGVSDDPESYALLDSLIGAQAYRLAFWRVSSEEINYRRFFDIDDLAAVRVERPEVFTATHQLVMRLLSEGWVTGLRVDHADGLRDPAGYFWQLQVQYLVQLLQAQLAPDPIPDDAVTSIEQALREARRVRKDGQWPLYVVAEKILNPRERLPADWAVYGTTGYDFLADLNGVMVNSRSRQAFTTINHRITPSQPTFDDLTNISKKAVMLTSMASELNALSHTLERLAKRTRHFCDFTLNIITFALREVLAGLDVYRTYITAGQEVTAQDRHWLEEAVIEAKRRNPRTAPELFDFLQDTLTFSNITEFPPDDHLELIGFVLRFQQVSGSVMAKGVEDTAFYRYNQLVSLNEVGAHPEHFGLAPAEFHRRNRHRALHWPHTLLATATHDTKRGEDVRPRISLLTEVPAEWRARITKWRSMNRRLKRRVDGQASPSGNDEYLLYQTLVGVVQPGDELHAERWAELEERVFAYMVKATREAKVITSWINVNEKYEAALRGFLAALLNQEGGNDFLADFLPFQHQIARAALATSLAQQATKLTAPGVPDIYQGAEYWDDSLVDPDNRRPIDFKARKQALTRVSRPVAKATQETYTTAGAADQKLALVGALLNLRKQLPQLFERGEYLPLRATGRYRNQLFAYARKLDQQWVLTAVPRLLVSSGLRPLGQTGPILWEDTAVTLPSGGPASWLSALEDRSIAVDNGQVTAEMLFQTMPVAVLTGQS